MSRKSTLSTSGKAGVRMRSAVRTALATAATLTMLVSAQLFASGSALSTTNQGTAVAATTQDTTATQSIVSEDDRQVTITTNQTGTIFSTRTQPLPGTHSSR